MKKQVLGTAVLLLLAGLSPVAMAAGTLAGTDITNVATATFDDPDNPSVRKTVNSNSSTLVVDELLNVTITPNDSGNVAVSPGDTDQVMSFTLSNIGNGPEQYILSTNTALAGNDFNPSGVQIWFDDGDGVFEPTEDTLYVPSGVLHVAGNEPVLGPDESVVVFVVSDIPVNRVDGVTPVGNGDEGNLMLIAEALTAQETAGTDPSGHVFVGSGTNGSDAIVGNTQAQGNSQNAYVISSIQTTFNKTSSVSHPLYGANPLPGATITYTLTFDVTGSGSLSNVVIADRIPTNTTFVNGSIELNGNPLTDVTDSDEGELRTGTGVNPPRDVVVTLPTAAAPGTYVVAFKVTIN